MPLSPDRARAASLIAAGHTHVETAEAIGCHKTTVTRWAQTSAFKEAVAAGDSKTDVSAELDAMQRAVDGRGRPDWHSRASAIRLTIALGLVSKDTVGGASEEERQPASPLSAPPRFHCRSRRARSRLVGDR